MWYLLPVNIKSEALNLFFYSTYRIKQLLSINSVNVWINWHFKKIWVQWISFFFSKVNKSTHLAHQDSNCIIFNRDHVGNVMSRSEIFVTSLHDTHRLFFHLDISVYYEHQYNNIHYSKMFSSFNSLLILTQIWIINLNSGCLNMFDSE